MTKLRLEMWFITNKQNYQNMVKPAVYSHRSCTQSQLKLLYLILVGVGARVRYQLFVVDLLSDEFVFTERITSFSGDGVNRSLLHLLLYGTIQHEERLARTLLKDRKRGGNEGKEGRFFFKRRKEEKEESQVYYYSLILKTHQGDLSQSPSFPMNKLAAALI